MTGRPPRWTPEEIEKYKENILTDIAINGLSLRKVCLQPYYPSHTTILEWLKEDETFAAHYARACEQRADKIFDEILEIADDTSNDTIETDYGPAENKEFINRSRLKIDARKWALSKMMPKKYGDRIDVTTDGEALNKSIEVVIVPPSEKD